MTHLDFWPPDDIIIKITQAEVSVRALKGVFWDETRQNWSLATAEGTFWFILFFGHQAAKFIF